MKIEIITKEQIEKYDYWVKKINNLNNNFDNNVEKIKDKIHQDIKNNGIDVLLGHLRLCGAIPEVYEHDTTAEKLYSKYTDIIIHEAYSYMGFRSIVLKERANVADVECISNNYSFVADAKAFRLSRTAKNQKDFKIQAVDNWKHGKDFAMVVCPIYQLPCRSSQIYQQATTRSVLISTYSHLSVLAQYSKEKKKKDVINLLHKIFKSVEIMNPSKDAINYWQIINRTILEHDQSIKKIWLKEKLASMEAIFIAKQMALNFLSTERERIMRLPRNKVVAELIKTKKIENRIAAINSVSLNKLLDLK